MTLKALPYVYKITNIHTNQFYIGSRTSKNQKHHSEDLGFKYFTSSKTVKQLGFENFKIDWIEEFQESETAYKFEQLIIFESFKDPLCLNKVCHFGKQKFSSTGLSWKLSEETILKSSISRTGLKRSNEAKLKMSNSAKGKIVSEEAKLKMSISKKNMSDETKLKMSISKNGHVSNNKGKILSVETKLKMSISAKGKPKSEEHKLKSSISRTGLKRSNETKLKMSKAAKNKPKIKCQYCNKEMITSNHTRWHGDKCKSK